MAKVNIIMEELIYTDELVVGKGMLKWKGVGVGGEVSTMVMGVVLGVYAREDIITALKITEFN